MKNTIEKQIISKIEKSSQSVFIRKDFENIGSYSHVSKVLKTLLEEKVLIKIGYGIYAKTKKCSLSGKIIPEKPLMDLAKELLYRLDIKTIQTDYEKDYNEGKSTQIPTGRVIRIKGKFLRKISYNNINIYFEHFS